jgi:hypothetical protein
MNRTAEFQPEPEPARALIVKHRHAIAPRHGGALPDPKAKPAHVRLHVGYWGDERNCFKWDQSVAVDPLGLSRTTKQTLGPFERSSGGPLIEAQPEADTTPQGWDRPHWWVRRSRMRFAGGTWRDLRLGRDRHRAPEEDHAYHETSDPSQQHLRPQRRRAGPATRKGRDRCIQAAGPEQRPVPIEGRRF